MIESGLFVGALIGAGMMLCAVVAAVYLGARAVFRAMMGGE